MPSIYEIADAVGVCPATVSRALNPALQHKVRASTLQKVRDYCNMHHYYGKLAARSLATGKTYCIGLVLGALEQDLSSPFFAEQIHGIVDVLSQNNYRLKIIPVSSTATDDVDSQVRKTLLSSEVDGFILNYPMVGAATMDELQNVHFPVVIQDTSNSPHVPSISVIPSFGFDNAPGYEELCLHLVTHGISHLAILGKERSENRICALRNAARKHGIGLEEFLFPDLSPAMGYQSMEMYRKVQEHWSALIRHPAWICMTDLWAFGARQALAENHRERDVFLCGYDNIEEIEGYRCSAQPVLNTIAIPRRQMGVEVARKLFTYEHRGKPTLLKSTFVLRTTCQGDIK